MNTTYIEAIKEALLVSGKILNDGFGKITASDQKQDQSNIVTQADLDSEYAILELLQKKFPSHNYLAEETGYQNQNSDFTWIIDPLDGTSNFASKIPWFGIIITLMKHSQPFATGVYLPQQKDMYWAQEGEGAYLNGDRIKVSEEKELKKVLFSYCLDYSSKVGQTEYESRIIAELVKRIRNLRATNSVTDFCYVADGRLGGCLNQTTKIWDIAGPALLVKESGGIATDHLGAELRFDLSQRQYDKNYTILVSNAHFHAIVAEIAAKLNN